VSALPRFAARVAAWRREMKCKYLEGENIAPRSLAEAKALIGKFVEYLPERDIDRSGRGYFFPRRGTVDSAKGQEIIINDSYIIIRNIREMVLMPSEEQ
jgi:hypothetical protein